MCTASNQDDIPFCTNDGKVYRKKGYIIPEASRTAKGTNIINLLPIENGEKVSAMLHTRDLDVEDEYLVMITRNGTVKRMYLNSLKNIRNIGIRAINLDEGDELISVRNTDGNQNILIATHDGYAICFKETDVRAMGRTATGVRGIRLREGDFCIGGVRTREGSCLLSVTENGYGKRTKIEEYLRGEDNNPQNRGGKGMKNYSVTEKTGKLADVKVVEDTDDVLVVSDDGTIIRMDADSISIIGRATQSVRIMRLAEGSKVISIAITDKEEATEAEAIEATAEVVEETVE